MAYNMIFLIMFCIFSRLFALKEKKTVASLSHIMMHSMLQIYTVYYKLYMNDSPSETKPRILCIIVFGGVYLNGRC